MRDDFATMILTHGRANNVKTVKTLRKANYTGRIYIVIDNEDNQADEYKRLYGDDVIVFDKLERWKTTDTISPSQKRDAVVFARNEAFNIAESLGLQYFLVLDDDYTSFDFRYADGNHLPIKNIKCFDELVDLFIEFLDASGAHTVAFAQAGDLLGGVNSSNYQKGILRKAMNAFFFRTDRRVEFTGLINEDVNAYVTLGGRGQLFFTIVPVTLVQKETQSNAGGLTDIYLRDGTYVKSFYSVITRPDCVMVKEMGQSHRRMHHSIEWDYCVPQILNERYRKARDDA